MATRIILAVKRLPALIVFSSITLSCQSDNVSDYVKTAEAFRAARKAGDFELAATLTTENARVWFDLKEGDGIPLTQGAGPYTEWDRHFKSKSELGEWSTNADSIWTIVTESNDYFRLIERKDTSRFKITYYFDNYGKIKGYLISEAFPDRPKQPSIDRFEEFKSWALANNPEEWDYLRPHDKLDPSGDRATRTRILLNEWRESVGLPVIE